MASRQRARPAKKPRAPNPLADLGIFDIPDVDIDIDNGDDSDVDESVLESELEAILSGKVTKPSRPKKKVAPPVDIERMAAECMKDIGEEDDDDDSALTDPELLKELQGLSCDSPEDIAVDNTEAELVSPTVEKTHPEAEPTPRASGDIVTLLQERLKLYNDAVAAAKAMNDSSKARRYGRAVKTLEGLIKTAKAGKVINEEDIPPVVSIPKARAKPLPPVPPPDADVSHDAPLVPPDVTIIGNLIDIPSEKTSETSSEKPVIQDEMTDASKTLIERRDQYKVAALHAKRAGDKATALKYMKMAKTFDSVLEALQNGEPVDISNIPPPPDAYMDTVAASASDAPKKELQETQTSSSIEAAALSAASEPTDPALFEAPPPPTSVLEALEQRLQKYAATKDAAEAEGNSSKVRRLQRIIKSYEKAIKDYKAGKPVDFEELPTPPGFAPIPVPSQTNAPPSEPANKPPPSLPKEKPNPEVKPPAPKRPAPQVPSKPVEKEKPKLQRTNTSTIDKQLEFLLERQRLFREAALAAKKNGDIQQAKEYLRMSKGFDSMIEATKCGLPIDASSIPTPPQLESDFVVVDVSDCTESGEGSPGELIETLEKDLTQQIEVCTRNKEHFLRLGDVSSASKFEKLGLESRKDLSVIRHLKKTGGSAPKFHYETRLFSMVQCHTDLGDNDLEVTVERGINLPGKPDDLDSYVKVDFPIPSDAPQRAKTHTIRDTNNPIFQEEFKFEINRKSRSQLRQFKRQVLKLEVWSKGGFLRSDALIGTAHVKLVDLESKCTIHDCFDLMDGRKACGGKLEVKVRIRDPLLVKQVEEVREKWLVIGS